jgi:hypothetical protein
MTSTSKDKIKFLLLEGIHPSAIAVIQAAGYTQIERLAGALSGEELKSRLAGVHFLGAVAHPIDPGRASTCQQARSGGLLLHWHQSGGSGGSA